MTPSIKRLKKWFFFFLILSIGSFEALVVAQKTMASDLFFQHKNLRHAGVGFKMVDIETGKVVKSYNENMALCPASTLKVLTTATALELLGKTYRFTTQIAYEGTIDPQGALTGDLIVLGQGDPSLGSSFFPGQTEGFLGDWVEKVRQAGIQSILGDIVVVDNLYGYEGVSNRWIWQDLGNYYASGTYGISVFDNTYQLVLRSKGVGSQPEVVSTIPDIPGLTFENHLKAAANSIDSAYLYGTPFNLKRQLYGSIPANRFRFIIKGDIPDPGLLLAQTFKRYLEKGDIKINGNAVTSKTKEQKGLNRPNLLYTHKGNTLQEIIQVTNFRSNNHFAEHLFHKIGWDRATAASVYVPALAAHRIQQFWRGKGIDTEGLFQYDGSGLSTSDAISANTLTALLVYMQKESKYADVFYQSLPIAGEEGTVRSFLKGTSLAGKARIKSGSISNVQAYAGYLEKGGKRYAFTLLINNFTGSRAVLKGQIEKLLQGI